MSTLFQQIEAQYDQFHDYNNPMGSGRLPIRSLHPPATADIPYGSSLADRGLMSNLLDLDDSGSSCRLAHMLTDDARAELDAWLGYTAQQSTLQPMNHTSHQWTQPSHVDDSGGYRES